MSGRAASEPRGTAQRDSVRRLPCRILSLAARAGDAAKDEVIFNSLCSADARHAGLVTRAPFYRLRETVILLDHGLRQ